MLVPFQKFEPTPVSRVFELFGLTEDVVKEVVWNGLIARQSCSALQPRIFPGLNQWANTVSALREKTIPSNWTFSEDNGFSLTIHPSGKLAIVVQTGSIETGTTCTPSNKAPKGTNTENAVTTNQRQLSLLPDSDDEFILSDKGNKPIIWVLLYHVAQNEIRFELSLPQKIVGGKIREWKERIVFPPIMLDQNVVDIGDDNGTEFDVPVERR